MSKGASSRRMMLWAAFVAFCTIGLAYEPLSAMKLPLVTHGTYYEVLIIAAAILGCGALLRVAGSPVRSSARTVSRILIAYLLFELLVVLPVAIWLNTSTVTVILDNMSVRFTWLLFPVVLMLCGTDDRTRRAVAVVAVVAAVCLVLWGVYSAATGGAGYYLEDGVVRYRVLYGSALLLFAWPFVLVASRAAPRRYAIALLGVALGGLALTDMRSGLIAFAVAGLACVAMSGQVRKIVPWIVPAALVAIVVALVWGQLLGSTFGYTMSHLFDLSSGNGADRVMRDVLAWNYFVSRPFNDYVWSWRYYAVYLQDAYIAHNFVLGIAVTEGVAGLAFYASVLTVALRGAWHWGRKDPIARALVGYLILYLVYALANATWYGLVNMAFLVAAVAGLVARTDQLRVAETCSAHDEPVLR